MPSSGGGAWARGGSSSRSNGGGGRMTARPGPRGIPSPPDSQGPLRPPTQVNNCAWATLVMRCELYACGALALGASLRRAGTEADLVCMVTEDISDDVTDALGRVWDHVVVVPRIEAERGALQRQQRRFGHMYNPWLGACLTKFSILAMAQYEKVAFLDADMLCVAQAQPPAALLLPPLSAQPQPEQAPALTESAGNGGVQADCGNREGDLSTTSSSSSSSSRRQDGNGSQDGAASDRQMDPGSSSSSSGATAGPSGPRSEQRSASGKGREQESVDALFQVPTPAGILDLHRKDPAWNEQWHGQPIPPGEVHRSLSSQCYAMRGCILLLEPDPSLFQEVLRIAHNEPIGHPQAMAGPDEYFITKYFLDNNITWHHIHYRYGMISWVPLQCPSAMGSSSPVFLHYVSEKPWAAPGDPSNPNPEVSQNWEDFKFWDDVVSSAVLPDLPDSLKQRLFSGWERRASLPRKACEGQ